MKKLFALLMVSAFLFAAAIPAGAYTTDVTLNAVQGTAVVDGVLDDIYTYSDAIEIKNFVSFANSGADEHLPDMATGVAHMVWDAEFLYVFYEITDKTVSDTETTSESTDAFEFIYDFGNNHVNSATAADSYGPYGFFMKIMPYYAKYNKEPTMNYAVSDYNTWLFDNGYQVVIKYTGTGYIVEQRFPSYPENPALIKGFIEGYVFGYAICILDDVDDDGLRDMKISWGRNDVDPPAGSMMTNGEASDRIKLVAAPVIKVETTAEETAAIAAEAAAPQTADAVLIMFAVTALSAAGILISKKRK